MPPSKYLGALTVEDRATLEQRLASQRTRTRRGTWCCPMGTLEVEGWPWTVQGQPAVLLSSE